MEKKARLIALYLPQFHPIPENDRWWGAGFTEWTNVAKAKPMFPGHYQPRLPADLGFYDLRVPETRVQQAEIAREHGIEAFCYYHYWFAGKRLLERPFNEVLSSGEPDFPFCLCWANQTWTGIWHGNPGRILIEQTYPGIEDHRSHFQELLRAFTDPRYVTVDGKPLLLIFMPMEIPDVKSVMEFWRGLAIKSGLKGLYLVGMNRNLSWVPQGHGFDGEVVDRLPPPRPKISRRHPFRKMYRKYEEAIGRPTIYEYAQVAPTLVPDGRPGIENFPCVIPGWDNTPRSRWNGLVLHNATPESFRRVLRKGVSLVQDKPPEHKLVFIKSWNEWAEGNYLEPDLRFGRAFLEIVREEVEEQSQFPVLGRYSVAGSEIDASSGTKRMVLVTNTNQRGGAEKHLLDLVTRVDTSRVQPIILCCDQDFYSDPLRQQLRLSVRVEPPVKCSGFLAYWSLFRRARPDIIVFNDATFDLFPWVAYLAAYLSAANVFSIQHLIPPPLLEQRPGSGVRATLRRLVGWRARYLLGFKVKGVLAKRTISVSDAVREQLVTNYGYPSRKSITIRNGVDLTKYAPDHHKRAAIRQDLGVRAEDSVLVCVSRLSKTKGIDILLRAMSAIRQTHPDCKCLVVGDGPWKAELSQMVRELELSSSTFLLGFKDDVRPYLRAADLFVLPSYEEGLPLSLLEAMACGLPCIATSVGGNAEVISHQEDGLIVSPGSADELASAISHLLSNPGERNEMARRALKKVQGSFDLEKTMRQLIDTLLN